MALAALVSLDFTLAQSAGGACSDPGTAADPVGDGLGALTGSHGT
jgi:hypothetical protein